MASRPPRRRIADSDEAGFTLLEVLISTVIMLVITGSIFGMLSSAGSAFRSQPEVSDMQQRLRVAAEMIYRDLMTAGAGLTTGAGAGPLVHYLPPIRPGRTGPISPDGELSQATDRINIIFVPPTRAQSRLGTAMGLPTSDLDPMLTEPGCPAGGPCGFAEGMRALIFDTTGVGSGYDLFTVTSAGATSVRHAVPNTPFSKAYANDITRLSEVEQHIYYLDSTTKRLMHYDGYQKERALVDDVVGLEFTYFADPDPNSAPQPAPGLASCVYNAGTPPVPLLTNLGGTRLKALTAAQLTDGPTCGIAPNRFDGDLLRIRQVRVTIRVEVGRADLRGASSQFMQQGSSKDAARIVPDYVMSFEVSPRNLNLAR